MNALDPTAIAATSGAALSLLFNYIPGLNKRFDALSSDAKRMCMGILIIVSGTVLALWNCVSESKTGHYICGPDLIDWRSLTTSIVFALIGNQATDRISPKIKS